MGKNKKRSYIIRWDRIAGVAFAFIVIIVLISTAISSCSKKDTPKNGKAKTPAQTTISSSEPAPKVSAISKTADDINKTGSNTGELLLINPEHQFVQGESQKHTVSIKENKTASYKLAYNDCELDPLAIKAIDNYITAYTAATGNADVQILKSYQPNTLDLKSDFASGFTFKIGLYSNSGNVAYKYDPEDPNHAWLTDSAYKYGLIVRYPEAKSDQFGSDNVSASTFRYVGVPIATYMHSKGFCLEEFLLDIKSYTADKPLAIETEDLTTYYAYYLPIVENGDTMFYYETGDNISIYGNNFDGFIAVYSKAGAVPPTTTATTATTTAPVTTTGVSG
jgi:LAS superfamily LD-carboxypeptidase LdcB